MNSKSRLTLTTAALAIMAPQLVFADIRAEDVWENNLAVFNTFGGDLTATPTRDGDALRSGSIVWNFTLPMDAGSFGLTISSFDMIDQPDGTVSMTYPDDLEIGFNIDIVDEDPLSGVVTFAFQGSETIATGTAGDITYNTVYDGIAIGLRDLESPDMDQVTVAMSGQMGPGTGTFRIQEGNVITVSGQQTDGPMELIAKITGEHDFEMDYVHRVGGGNHKYTAILPTGGMDIMNLAASLRAGLSISGESTSVGYENTQNMMIDGTPASQQTIKVEEQAATFRFDQDGVFYSGPATGVSVNMLIPEVFPLPIEASIDSTDSTLRLPISASDALQKAEIFAALDGLQISEGLWSIFDPTEQLPRDPMALDFDVTMDVKNFVDWLDFMKLAELGNSPDMPAELHALEIRNLMLSAVGARFSATGSASFDNTDLASFGGMPKPTGAMDVEIQGVNGLIDKLIGMGLLSEQDAMGGRMMMSMFTVPNPDGGEDALKSKLEITEEGHVLANGQRLQ